MDTMDKMEKKDRMGIARSVLGSAGAAGLAVLMVGVVAFGATVVRPLNAANDIDADATATAAPADSSQFGRGDEVAFDVMDGNGKGEHPYQPKPKPDPTQKPKPSEQPKADRTPAPKPAEQPKQTAKPQPKETAEPQPKETAKPKPAPTTLALEAWVKDASSGKVKMAWSKYAADGFAYYKVVRSWDANVAWPMGGDDKLVTAIGDPYAPFAVDAAPCGDEVHYRVFAVRHAEAGYAVLAASNTVAIFFECKPEPTPPPAPVVLAFTVQQVDGKAVLSWSKCGGEGFVYYKVVRSATNATPTYPLNAGDELLAAIGDPNQTAFVDAGVEPGQSWTYRVLCFGQNSHGKFVMGATPAMTLVVQ